MYVKAGEITGMPSSNFTYGNTTKSVEYFCSTILVVCSCLFVYHFAIKIGCDLFLVFVQLISLPTEKFLVLRIKLNY
jgi:hypothetical protein